MNSKKIVWAYITPVLLSFFVMSACDLVGIGYITLMVLGIFFVVGIDVGINATSGQLLLVKMQMSPETAQQGRSLYFFGKMLGTFIGALLLVKFSPEKFLTGSAAATLLATVVFRFVQHNRRYVCFCFLCNIFVVCFYLFIEKSLKCTKL